MSDSTNKSNQAQNAITAPLLEVRGLRVHFDYRHGPLWRRETGVVRAVDGVSFSINRGETFGLVGESGSGKSTVARAILRLTPVTDGRIIFEGAAIQHLGEREMGPLRARLQMVFQDPFGSLNPRMSVGRIIAEPLAIFRVYDRATRRLEAMRLMDLVGINPRYINRYPHEFSGGQRQRIGIARALALNPALIVCDEPVSALDVSIQAQIINLLREIQQQLHVAYLFIAHDLSVVRHMSDRVGVMSQGQLVECGAADDLYRNPQHPYTQSLLSAAPALPV